MDLLGDYEQRVEEATEGRDMRCANPGCAMYGVVLEVDEIEILDSEQPLCASCQRALILWTDDQSA